MAERTQPASGPVARGAIEPIDLKQARSAVLSELEQLEALRLFPFVERSHKTCRKASFHRPRRLYRSDFGLDTSGFASFDWLGVSPVESPPERRAFLSRIREFLSLMLESLSISEDTDADEVDGLPSDFDGWIYGITCRMIVQMNEADDPGSLWRPILDLGAFAHEWVERFFWHWFIEGINASSRRCVWSSLGGNDPLYLGFSKMGDGKRQVILLG